MARRSQTSPRPRPAPTAGAGAGSGMTPATSPLPAAAPTASDPVVAILLATPRYVSPAVALCQALENTFQPEDILRLEPQIEAAITETEKEMGTIARAADALRRSSAVPATIVPEGF